jgi:DNA-binding transcriptional LysR family regulator
MESLGERRNRYKYNGVNTNLSATEFLVEEGIDVAIRMGPRVDSGLVAREIADASVFVCSSKGYLKKPRCPEAAARSCLSQLPDLRILTSGNGLAIRAH